MMLSCLLICYYLYYQAFASIFIADDAPDNSISFFVNQIFWKISADAYNKDLKKHNHVLLSTILLIVHEISPNDVFFLQVKDVEESPANTAQLRERKTPTETSRIWVRYCITIPNIYSLGFQDYDEAYNVTSNKLLLSQSTKVLNSNLFDHYFTTLAQTNDAYALLPVTTSHMTISSYQVGRNMTVTEDVHHSDTALSIYSLIMLVVFLSIVFVGVIRIVYRLYRLRYFDRKNRIYPTVTIESLPTATTVIVLTDGDINNLESGPNVEEGTHIPSITNEFSAVIAQPVQIDAYATVIAFPASSSSTAYPTASAATIITTTDIQSQSTR